MKETFGQRLSRIRKEKGYTQEDIASRITISPQAVSKWENDISSPDILILSNLADILDVSVDELLGREGSETVRERVEVEEGVHIQDKKGRGVHIGDEGVHLVDDDGSGLHITDDGIFIQDKEGHIQKKQMRPSKVSVIVSSITFGLAIIGFILMGLLWTDQAMGWKMGWILFLLTPIVGSLFSAVMKKKFTQFAYPVAVVAAYCTLGFLGMYLDFNGWGFYWFLFLTIPAYYIIFGNIDKYVIHRNDPNVIENE